MLVKVSTEKINSSSGRVTVKSMAGGIMNVITVSHKQIIECNGIQYIFTIGSSCCACYLASCQGLGGDTVDCAGEEITCGPEKIINI